MVQAGQTRRHTNPEAKTLSSQSASFPFGTSVRNSATIQHSSCQTGPKMAPSFKVVRLGSKQTDKHQPCREGFIPVTLLQHLALSPAFLAMTPINRRKLGKSIASWKWGNYSKSIKHEVTHEFRVEMILKSRMSLVLCVVEYSLHLIQPTQSQR